jgi:hypothetical protein
MNYGAVNAQGNENFQRCYAWPSPDRSWNGRASFKTTVCSVMTVLVVCLLVGKMGEKHTDSKALVSRLSELRQISRSRLTNVNAINQPQSLASKDFASYGNYAEDMKDGKNFLPPPSGLFQQPMNVQCSDTVSWGRLRHDDPCFQLMLFFIIE